MRRCRGRRGHHAALAAITVVAVTIPFATDETRAAGATAVCAPEADLTGSHEVVLWHPLANNPERVLSEHVSAFNAGQSTITLTSVQKGNYDILLADLAAAAPDDRPDIIVGAEGSVLNLAREDLTIPPGACVGDDAFADLMPIVAATYSVADALVAVPYNVSTPVLIFNAALVREAGLDPAAPPADLAELRAASDQVRESGAAAHGLIVYDQYGAWFIRQFAAQRGDVLAEPDNGRAGAGVEGWNLTTDEIVRDLEWLRDGIVDGSFLWIGGNPSSYDDLLPLTTESAEAVYTIHTSASIGDLIAILEGGAFPGSEIGVGPLPGGGGLVGGGALWIMDHDDPVQARAAWEAIEFLTAPAQSAQLAAATGYVPPRAATLDEPELIEAWADHPQLQVGFDQLAAMDRSPASAGLLVIASRTLDLEVNGLMGQLLFDDVDVRTFVEELEATFAGIVADSEYGRLSIDPKMRSVTGSSSAS